MSVTPQRSNLGVVGEPCVQVYQSKHDHQPDSNRLNIHPLKNSLNHDGKLKIANRRSINQRHTNNDDHINARRTQEPHLILISIRSDPA
jgi:hypothetical protein